MARAQGARAQMALAFETIYGTPPASGFTRMPFASTTLGSEQPLLNSELLGYGRDPLAPVKDAVTADGDVVVPIDAATFGFWLKAAFGTSTTTGTAPGPFTHTFQSGSWTLPSMAIETGMPEVPRYAMYTGVVLDQLTWQMQRSGLLTATARLVAQGETVSTTTQAGTPAELDLIRFGHFNGAIKRNGTALGNVISTEITYANNLDRIETIRADGMIDGADPSIAALTGRTEVRFATFSLSGALALLRGAIVRTGIGALIVAAGELIYWFGQLVKGAGGFGRALELMGNLAGAVWDGIKAVASSFVDDFRSIKASVEQLWLKLMAFLSNKWADFLATIGPTFNTVAETLGTDARIDWFGAQSYASMLDHAVSNAGVMADRYRQRAQDTRAHAFDAVGPAAQALGDAIKDADSAASLDDAAAAAGRVTTALDSSAAAAKKAGKANKDASDEAVTGWDAVVKSLTDYAAKARDIGADVGNALVNAFQGAENAIGEFVKTGKLKFGDLVTSLIADLAKLAARRFILGPIANALSGVLGSAGGLFANILHAGGVVSASGPGRMVPAMAFAGAPRMHSGGWAGLRPDEVPAILQRGERVLSRRETAAAARGAVAPTVNITIMTRDAESFRQSRTQVAADIARAVSLGRRGL